MLTKQAARVELVNQTTYEALALTIDNRVNESFKRRQGDRYWKQYVVYADQDNQRLSVFGAKRKYSTGTIDFDVVEAGCGIDLTKADTLKAAELEALARFIHQHEKEKKWKAEVEPLASLGLISGILLGSSAALLPHAGAFAVFYANPAFLLHSMPLFIILPALLLMIGCISFFAGLPGFRYEDSKSQIAVMVGAALIGAGLGLIIAAATFAAPGITGAAYVATLHVALIGSATLGAFVAPMLIALGAAFVELAVVLYDEIKRPVLVSDEDSIEFSAVEEDSSKEAPKQPELYSKHEKSEWTAFFAKAEEEKVFTVAPTLGM